MGFDDGAADGQAHAHAAFLGAVEGAEDVFAVVFVDTGAVVGHMQAHLLARRVGIEPDAHLGRGAGGAAGPVLGVADEVDHHMLQQQAVGLHPQAAVVGQGLQAHAGAAGMHAHRLADKRRHIHHLARQLAPPRKGVDALDDAAGLVGQAGHALDHRLQLGQADGACAQAVEQAVGKAAEGTERLVQLVGQGGGDFAHGDQSARGFELFLLHGGQALGAFALADVEHRAHPADVFAGGGGERGFVDEHVHPPPVAVLELHLHPLGVGALGNDVAVHHVEFGHVFGRPVGQGGRAAHQLGGAVAHHAAEGFVDVEDLALPCPGPQADGDGVFHGGAQGHLGLQQRLHMLALAHVAAQRGQADQHAQQKQQGQQQEQPGHHRGLGVVRGHFDEQVGARQVHGGQVAEGLAVSAGGREAACRCAAVADQGDGVLLVEPRGHQALHAGVHGQGGHVVAHELAALEQRHRQPHHVGGAAVGLAHGAAVGRAAQAHGNVEHAGQRVGIGGVAGFVGLPAGGRLHGGRGVRGGGAAGCAVARVCGAAGVLAGLPAVPQHRTGLVPQQAALHGGALRLGVAVCVARAAGGGVAGRGGLHGLAGQQLQVVFQAGEVKAHALLQPLAIGHAAAFFFAALVGAEVEHQRHHRGHHQPQQPQHQPQHAAAALALACGGLLEQGEVQRLVRRLAWRSGAGVGLHRSDGGAARS